LFIYPDIKKRKELNKELCTQVLVSANYRQFIANLLDAPSNGCLHCWRWNRTYAVDM